MDDPRQIDWSTAVVEGGVLKVELTGEPARDYAAHLEGVLHRLDARRAAAIKVTKTRIKVAEVEADSADELRHLLESAIAQTNADLRRPQTQTDSGSQDDDDDRRLTAAFREFAPVEAH